MDHNTIGTSNKVNAFNNASQHKPARPIDRPVPALRPISERHAPLDMWVLLSHPPECVPDAPAFTIAREPVGKRHAVQFDKLVPKRARHKPQHLPLVQRRAELHGPSALPVEEHAEMQLRIVDHLPAVVKLAHYPVGVRRRYRLND
jgi:hypothetical protein